MDNLFAFLLELDRLKSVYRRSYLTDLSRNENSAEHSWHVAIAILILRDELNIDIDLAKTVKMALVHDVCEIGAGDISVYSPDRQKKEIEEREYIRRLAASPVRFALEIEQLWEEYEAQNTIESRWVKVVDRLLPFALNMATEGRSWKEQGIRKSQVKEINRVIEQEAPSVYDWILLQIEFAVERGWLVG